MKLKEKIKEHINEYIGLYIAAILGFGTITGASVNHYAQNQDAKNAKIVVAEQLSETEIPTIFYGFDDNNNSEIDRIKLRHYVYGPRTVIVSTNEFSREDSLFNELEKKINYLSNK